MLKELIHALALNLKFFHCRVQLYQRLHGLLDYFVVFNAAFKAIELEDGLHFWRDIKCRGICNEPPVLCLPK